MFPDQLRVEGGIRRSLAAEQPRGEQVHVRQGDGDAGDSGPGPVKGHILKESRRGEKFLSHLTSFFRPKKNVMPRKSRLANEAEREAKKVHLSLSSPASAAAASNREMRSDLRAGAVKASFVKMSNQKLLVTLIELCKPPISKDPTENPAFPPAIDDVRFVAGAFFIVIRKKMGGWWYSGRFGLWCVWYETLSSLSLSPPLSLSLSPPLPCVRGRSFVTSHLRQSGGGREGEMGVRAGLSRPEGTSKIDFLLTPLSLSLGFPGGASPGQNLANSEQICLIFAVLRERGTKFKVLWKIETTPPRQRARQLHTHQDVFTLQPFAQHSRDMCNRSPSELLLQYKDIFCCYPYYTCTTSESLPQAFPPPPPGQVFNDEHWKQLLLLPSGDRLRALRVENFLYLY